MSGMPLLKSAIPFGQSENRFCNQSTKIGCFVGTGVESIQPPKPFQAEHTPAVISNGYHHRMSVSVAAGPSNGLRA